MLTTILLVLLCLAAIVFALAALNRAASFNPKPLLAYCAAGLGGLRLVIAGIDYTLVEQAMEIARNTMRKTAGYSYNSMGTALNQAEDFGTTAMMLLGLVLAIFWAITAVVFWDSKPELASVDRML